MNGRGKKIQFHSRHFLRKPSRAFRPAQVPTGHSTKYHLILIPLNFNAWKCDLGLSGAGGVTLGRMNIQTVACRATASGVLLESKGFVCFFLLSCLFKRALSSTLEMRKVRFVIFAFFRLLHPSCRLRPLRLVRNHGSSNEASVFNGRLQINVCCRVSGIIADVSLIVVLLQI